MSVSETKRKYPQWLEDWFTNYPYMRKLVEFYSPTGWLTILVVILLLLWFATHWYLFFIFIAGMVVGRVTAGAKTPKEAWDRISNAVGSTASEKGSDEGKSTDAGEKASGN